MMRPNLYAAPCSICGTQVEPNEGFASPPPGGHGRWITRCLKCSGYDAPPKPTIRVAREPDGRVLIQPTSFLGGNLFADYRRATEGSKFDPARKVQLSPMALAPAIICKLHDAGFVVDIPQDLADSLRGQTDTIKTEVSSALDRADKVDKELHERGLALFPFQRIGVQWLASRTNALLSDDMGLGKTIQALTAIPDGAPVVVVAPAVAKGVWKRECEKWRPEIKVTVLKGRGSFRWPEPKECVIINYDILSVPKESCPDGTILISDEAHNLKSSDAKRTKNFRAISAKVAATGKVWLLTATALLNRPPELWNVLQAGSIAREAFGSWSNFLRLFNAQPGEWGGYSWGHPEPEVAERLQRVSLRRTKTEVLPDLPQKMWREITVEIDAQTKKLCKKSEELLDSYTRFSRILGDSNPTEVAEQEKKSRFGDLAEDIETALFCLDKMNTAKFNEISAARTALAKAKIPTLLELVEQYEEQDEPVVVFSAHRAPVDFLANRPGWASITGDTPTEKRTQIENDFQAGKLRGLAGTITAMGVAITLTRASQAIFVDLEWTPALNAQAEDRLCRIGQTRGVCITILTGNVYLDERVNFLLMQKRGVIRASIDAAANKNPEIVIPDIDLASIKKDAEEEAKKQEKAKQYEQENKEKHEKQREETEKALNEAKRQEKKNRILRAARANLSERRAAKDSRETWAADGLLVLADLDPDRAAYKNEVGFNASDGKLGHRLAIMLEIGLTDSEWTEAIDLCKKYHRQIGTCPTEDTDAN